MSRLGKVKVYDAKLHSMFAGSGEVGEETRKMTAEIMRVAKSPGYVPVRTGELRKKHYTNFLRSGRLLARGYVGNTAPHADWVYSGTKGPILPKGTYLVVPRGRGRPSKRHGAPMKFLSLRRSVRGQRANHWIERAADSVLRSGGY
jgi:hypothetical protein